MSKFRVSVRQVVVEVYEVEADSADDASSNYLDGAFILSATEESDVFSVSPLD